MGESQAEKTPAKTESRIVRMEVRIGIEKPNLANSLWKRRILNEKRGSHNEPLFDNYEAIGLVGCVLGIKIGPSIGPIGSTKSTYIGNICKETD